MQRLSIRLSSSQEMFLFIQTLAKAYENNEASIKETLKDHILKPVFEQSILKAYEDGVRVFVEFGPKRVLSSLVAKILEGKEHFVVSINFLLKARSYNCKQL